MRKIYTLSIAIFLMHFVTLGQPGNGTWLYRCNEKLVEIIMEDLFTPPVASRVQLYPNIAAYEVLCFKDKKLRSLAGQLKGLERISQPTTNVDYSLSATVAFNLVARRLIYSEYIIDDFQRKETENWLALNKDTALLNNSIAFGRSSADQIITWLRK